VFFTVVIVGFVKNGTSFLSLFWVSSAPLALRPILAVIEVISFFVRPVSHSVRLAGAIMAGHAVMKVFAAFAGAALIAPDRHRRHGRDLRARIPRGRHPGLRLHHPDLRLPQGRAASAPLTVRHRTSANSNVRRSRTWKAISQNGSVHRRRPRRHRFRRAAIGVGNVAGNFLAGALRNPSAAAGQTATLFIGIAFAEALGIFAFLVALLLMFAV
jgi:F0F1-type ATP synthase membrane subunit c/vacuolar-type H+-ATPase subunit K